jgi:hypothetical protein
MLVIGPEHSNSRVWGDVGQTSTWSDDLSQWKIQTTHYGLWRTPSSGNGDEITDEWYMCTP